MIWLRIGSAVMFARIALGAFGAHGLKTILSEEGKQIYQTAVFYHLIHGLAFLALAWLATVQPELKGFQVGVTTWNPLVLAGICFAAGIVLFSGSLYLLAVTGIRKLGIVTPFGGLAFLAGWIVLFLTAGL